MRPSNLLITKITGGSMQCIMSLIITASKKFGLTATSRIKSNFRVIIKQRHRDQYMQRWKAEISSSNRFSSLNNLKGTFGRSRYIDHKRSRNTSNLYASAYRYEPLFDIHEKENHWYIYLPSLHQWLWLDVITQPFIQDAYQRKLKAPRHWPLIVKGICRWPVNSPHKGPVTRHHEDPAGYTNRHVILEKWKTLITMRSKFHPWFRRKQITNGV